MNYDKFNLKLHLAQRKGGGGPLGWTMGGHGCRGCHTPCNCFIVDEEGDDAY